jgi:histone deacetylase 6
VAIVDWDIHHGNGTQEMFYKSKDVLYLSIHRYDQKTFYPRIEQSQAEFTGEGEGEGFNINIAWETGTNSTEQQKSGETLKLGNQEYRRAFEGVILPVLKEYQPDLILISCGFDAAIHDQLGRCRVSSSTYFWMTQ